MSLADMLMIAISTQSMKRTMQKVKELTDRGTNLTLEETMKRINNLIVTERSFFISSAVKPIPLGLGYKAETIQAQPFRVGL